MGHKNKLFRPSEERDPMKRPIWSRGLGTLCRDGGSRVPARSEVATGWRENREKDTGPFTNRTYIVGEEAASRSLQNEDHV